MTIQHISIPSNHEVIHGALLGSLADRKCLFCHQDMRRQTSYDNSVVECIHTEYPNQPGCMRAWYDHDRCEGFRIFLTTSPPYLAMRLYRSEKLFEVLSKTTDAIAQYKWVLLVDVFNVRKYTIAQLEQKIKLYLLLS